jgi:hypothetical protein
MASDGVAGETRVRIPGRAITAAIALVVGVSAVSFAVSSQLRDPNDTSGALDVRLVKFNHPKGEPPSWTVLTFTTWKIGQMWDRGYVFLEFDTEGQEAADHYAVVRSDGRSMQGELFRVATRAGRPDQKIADLKVWRKSLDGVSVTVPLKRMDFGPYRDYYRWWIVTTLTADKCPNTCLDRVPDDGSVQQWLPGASPPPSATPPG